MERPMQSLTERIHEAAAALPDELQPWAAAVCLQPDFTGQLTAEQAAEACRLLGGSAEPVSLDQLMLTILPLARAYATMPVSDFPVGAWIEGGSGTLYAGANQEFRGVSLNHSIHAEQAAITHAWQGGETIVRRLAVTASPCGHCRQFLNELDSRQQVSVLLPDSAPLTITQLLPDAFGPENLGISSGLLAALPATDLWIASDDPVLQLAAREAARSYAPYSNAQSAVVLVLDDGRQLAGRYAENAAFNPSLPPMQAALLARRWLTSAGNIERAVLVERADCMVSQLNESREVLHSECAVKLEHWLAEPR